MSGLPNSAAIFDSKIPYFLEQMNILQFLTLFLMFNFNDPAREPKSLTVIDLLSEINLFLTFSILQTILRQFYSGIFSRQDQKQTDYEFHVPFMSCIEECISDILKA